MQFIQEIATKAIDQGYIIFSDTFDNNENNWILGTHIDNNGGKVAQKIENGIYYWEIISGTNNLFQASSNSIVVKDFYLSVEITVIDSKRTSTLHSINSGLVFRKDKSGNFYIFSIDPGGVYSLKRYYNGEWTNLINAISPPEFINDETNRLAVIAQRDQFFLFINDHFLAEGRDNLIEEGNFALAISWTWGSQQLALGFDNLVLRIP